jgi:alpha,alpha-trehalase
MSRAYGAIAAVDFDAVLFDLDGVLTDTAKVHAASWKRMFDRFLQAWADEHDEPFRPFEIGTDYATYVDGRPRYEGVKRFLASRDIELPDGQSQDPPTCRTVCGLGNHKNDLFNEVLNTDGVEVYASSISLVHHLRDQGIKTAVVSSSRNGQGVLDAAGIADLFDVRVDGEIAARLHLAGKPAPDTFLYAAEQLGVTPGRAVVVEDALSGVQAGRRGGFGLVIGVDRGGEAQTLLANGADLVVADLSECLP